MVESVQRRVAEGAEGTQREGDLNALTEAVIGAAIAVHRVLGPGLLESSYQACLARELDEQGIAYQSQMPLAIHYRDLVVPSAYRVDLLVAGQVIIELKAVDRLESIHEQQLLTYLRHADLRLGLVINFNVKRLVDGIRRVVNQFDEK